jgi:hypothetical protein
MGWVFVNISYNDINKSCKARLDLFKLSGSAIRPDVMDHRRVYPSSRESSTQVATAALGRSRSTPSAGVEAVEAVRRLKGL